MQSELESPIEVFAADGARLRLWTRSASVLSESSAEPSFLLLHGFAQSGAAFLGGPWPSALAARGARVFIAELRGRSEAAARWTRSWSLADHLRLDLPALIDAVVRIAGTPRVHVLGHSMGGMLGYALLATESARVGSLLTLGAPVRLGLDRPLVRLASRVAQRVVPPSTPFIPMNRILRLVAPMAVRPSRRGLLRGRVRELIRLANPEESDAALVRQLLELSEAEAAKVLLELARLASRPGPEIDGVDLTRALAESQVPVAAVVGERDVFCGLDSVGEVVRRAGPGRVVALPGHAHVDLTLGRQVTRVLDELYPFLLDRRA